MVNTYTFDKDKNILLKSEVLPLGTVVTTYTWKINNVNRNQNTPNLTINTTTDLNEGKNIVSLVVICEHGTVSNEYIAEINIGTPIPSETKYKFTAYPDYTCVPVTNNPLGIKLFDTKEECELVASSVSHTLKPTLISITPTEAKVGQEVTITLKGKDFNPLAYPNFYSNGAYIDHGYYISGNETTIVVKRKFTTVETMTVKVNNRNQTLSATALPFKVLPDIPPTSSPVKIKVDKTIVITVTDSVTNLPVQNMNVESNGETKVTDSQGKVMFN